MECQAATKLGLGGCGGDIKCLLDLKSYEKTRILDFADGFFCRESNLCAEHIKQLSTGFKKTCANPFQDHGDGDSKSARELRAKKFMAIEAKHPGLIKPLEGLCKRCLGKATDTTKKTPDSPTDPIPIDVHEDDQFSTNRLEKLNQVRLALGLESVGYTKRNNAAKIKLVRDCVTEIKESLLNLFDLPEIEKKVFSVPAVDLQSKLQDASRSERIRVAALFAKSMSLKELCETFRISKRAATIARKLHEDHALTELPRRQRKGIGEDTEALVRNFYLDDDNSRQSPNTKDVLHWRNSANGTEETVVKRYLSVTLGELYAKFSEANPLVKVGHTKFCQLRPKFCKLLRETKNQVCLCIYHENIRLLFESVNLCYSDYLKYLACDPSKKTCMFRKCSVCSSEEKEDQFSQKLKADILQKHPKYEELDISFYEWSQGGRDLLVKSSLSIDDFVDHLVGKCLPFLRHHFTTKSQSRAWKDMKANLDSTTVLIQCDFAENYSCSYNMEVQKVYFNQIQTTLHPFVATLKTEQGVTETKSYVVVSDELQHNSNTYYAFQRRILQEIKENFPHIKTVVYWSDGAGSQYKNFKNMCNVRNHKADHGLDASHNFFASCHGKGPCDAIGGTVKSQLKNAAKAGEIIQSPQEVFDYLEKLKGKTKPFFVSSEDVRNVIETMELEDRYAKAIKIPRIREMHRMVANERTMDLYELSTDTEVCCILTFEERYDVTGTEEGDWIAAIYDEAWYFGIVKKILFENEELHVKFLKTPGDRITTFTNSSFEKSLTYVPFCNVISKISSPTRVGKSRTQSFSTTAKEKIAEKYRKMT